MNVYIVEENWNFPTESGHEIIGVFNTYEKALDFMYTISNDLCDQWEDTMQEVYLTDSGETYFCLHSEDEILFNDLYIIIKELI